MTPDIVLFQFTTTALLLLDSDQRCVKINPAAETLLENNTDVFLCNRELCFSSRHLKRQWQAMVSQLHPIDYEFTSSEFAVFLDEYATSQAPILIRLVTIPQDNIRNISAGNELVRYYVFIEPIEKSVSYTHLTLPTKA